MSEAWLEFWRYTSVFICHSATLAMITDCRFSRRANFWIWTAAGALSCLVPAALAVGGVSGYFRMYSVVSAVTMTVYAVVFVSISRGPWQKTLFLFTIYATLFYLFVQIIYSAVQIWLPEALWVSIVVRTVCFILLILLLRRRWRRFVDMLAANICGEWGSLAAFSLMAGGAVYMTLLLWIHLLDDSPRKLLVVLVMELALILVECAALVRMVLLMGRQQAVQAEGAQRRLLETQLTAERAYVDQARAHRHDMRHHMLMLGDYLERGDVSGAKAYLAQHQALLDTERLVRYCENTVANALLRLTQKRCETEGVPCKIHASVPERISLTGPELATVLGNVLENAWEANRRALVPKLSVRAYCQNGLVLIEVENGVSGEIRFRDGLPETTKPGGGLGLKNVVRVLEKYDGMLYCTRQCDFFFTQIIFPV